MKRLILFLLGLMIIGCAKLIDKPAHLVPKKEMAEILAEFALNEQLTVLADNINLDNSTRYTLQQKKIKGNDFVESYKYYTATGDIESILEKAQDIVLNQDPKAKIYIEKKLKENSNVPAFAR